MLTDSEAALARAVLLHGPISRARLAELLDLSPPSLTRLTKPFLDQDILIEREETSTGVGRPARPLDVSPRLGRFLGVKITGDTIYVVSTDARATLLGSSEHPLSATSPEAVADDVATALSQMDPGAAGVGVCLGGSIQHGVVQRAPFLGWTEVDFASILRERIPAPLVVENDVVALAEAERWFGFGRELRGFLLVTIGAGVGYCLVVGDEVIRSADVGMGAASDLVVTHDDDGRPRVLGEALSSPSISARVSRRRGERTSWEDALHLAAQGDRVVLEVLEESADALGKFIAVAATLTLQDVVIVAGEGIGLLAITDARVRAAIAAHRPPGTSGPTMLVDRTGFSAWARGAAGVSIQAAMATIDLRRSEPTE